MDDSWNNFNFAWQSSNNCEVVSDAGAGSDIASTDGAASSSNLRNESAPTKRERDKEYKNKSRQKQADEKELLELKCRVNEAEAKRYKEKWNHVKFHVQFDDSIDDMCRRLAELNAGFVKKYGAPPFQGRGFVSASKTERRSSRRENEENLQETPESNFTKAGFEARLKEPGPRTKKTRISEKRERWNFCPMCGYCLQSGASPLMLTAGEPQNPQGYSRAQPTFTKQPVAARGLVQAFSANSSHPLPFDSAYNAPMISTSDHHMASTSFFEPVQRPTDLPIAQYRGGPSAWDAWM